MLTASFTDTMPVGVTTIEETASTTCTGGVATQEANSVSLSAGAVIPAEGSCVLTVEVTASIAQNYVNTIAAGALQTNHGSNQEPVVATLTVVPVVNVAPGIEKEFSPAKIDLGDPSKGFSTLTITFTNPNSTPAHLTEPFTDTLPQGVKIVGEGSTTCGGTVSVTQAKTESEITLSGGSIPAKGSCTLIVKVSADQEGKFVNTIPVGALQTIHGSNIHEATATLKVTCKGKICYLR